MPTPLSLQRLAPRWARLCLEVDKQLHRLVPDITDSRLLVACSGGSDSMALLHILRYIAPRNELTLHVAHLDHQLRPESGADARFVQDACEHANLSFHSRQSNISKLARQKHVGLEEAGRIERYAFLEQVRAEQDCAHVLLAHHQDDLVEDVLLRLIRGSGWPALGGMTAHDAQRNLLRPLLNIGKQKLRSFLEENALTWREDATNEDKAFTRNRIRQDIAPLLFKENPNLGDAVYRLNQIAELDQDFFSSCMDVIASDVSEAGVSFAMEDLQSIHSSIRIRLYKKTLDQMGPGQVLSDTLVELDQAVSRMPLPRETTFQFPGTKTVALRGKTILFQGP